MTDQAVIELADQIERIRADIDRRIAALRADLADLDEIAGAEVLELSKRVAELEKDQ